eukprot:NODE_3426_length_896_cov_52.365410_g3404_i0.p1 GENE.NODE_3426_length_896_cov_52.365410_g3404_i0~~NODE_3426_length_896_cov_52.365410_g3404_i0.p1  ORF type:complete len:270 (+),score=71.86 NODE_3426_length_896_cov_52.365410_g3404_i0:113-811(+)
MNDLAADPECRVVVLSAAGRLFTAGLDLADADISGGGEKVDPARRAMQLRQLILDWQAAITSIERCRKPVIAAVHGACIGGGIDLISACDVRLCTADAFFSIKEVDVGLAADVGTLQRFPKIIGNDSKARELAFTGRKFDAKEAAQMGMVSNVYANQEELMKQATAMADLIASKSPVAVQGTKVNMVFSRDHTVQEGLDYIAAWNMGMLQSEDVMKAAAASLMKQTPTFAKL